MDFGRTKMTFNALKTNNPEELYGLCDLHKNESGESMAVATKIPFAEGFFKNMKVKRENVFLLIAMIPLAVVGAIAAVAIAISGKGIARSLSAFPAVFAFAAPIGSLFVNAWQKLCVTISLLGKKAGLIGELSEEQVNIDFAVFDDETVFPSENIKILNIRFYNNAEIYKTLYNVNALFEGVGGPLRDIMKYTSSDLGAPSSVEIVSASEHFVEALIDGKTSVCAGSALALSRRGIVVQQDPQDAKDSQSAVVMYAAVNREVLARFCIEYNIDVDFLRESAKLAVDGVGIKVKTLDPNIDKAMLLFAFGEDIPTSIIREPKSKECLETGSVTSVFARGEAKNLVTPLVMGRRIKRVEKTMGTATVVEMSIGVFVSVALLLIGVPGTLLPGAATAVQLLMLIPSVMVYLLGMNTSSRKKDKKTER
jgi:hypothetical protein